jgi:hypothetical protein
MPDEPASPLGAAEIRVLGCLVEKDITTPDYYPLTLNALTNACNQSTNRDPVVAYSEQEVVRALDALRARKLAFAFQGADSRVAKFGHRFAETFALDRPATSALCVLMLRGPQTVGELRGRTGRMHDFASLQEVEAVLDSLAARTPDPLVAKLRRQAGMKEQRYVQLLGGPPDEAASPAVAPGAPAQAGDAARIAALEAESAALRRDVDVLRRQLDELRSQLG